MVRFDDLQTGRAVVFDEPFRTTAAWTYPEVRGLIARAEAEAREGRWVALMVAYEAGPAFDAHQEVHEPIAGFPLAWMAVAGSVAETEAVRWPANPVAVTGISRRGGAEWFARGVSEVHEIIASGSAYQINLTDRLDGRVEGDPFDLYARLCAGQRGRYSAYLDLGDHVVVSASPELFVEVRDGVVTSRPMKGTARRAAEADADRAVAAALQASPKDCAENVMITDLLRNDIGRIARVGSVRVPNLLQLERYETVWQLTSTVSGAIENDVSLLDLFDALFPCGSITGAPKISAMRHIRRLEPWARGAYCGTVGLLRPSPSPAVRPHATFSVAIRTAVVSAEDGTFTYGAGGGITIDSDPAGENRELEAKAAILTDLRPPFELLETMRAQFGTVMHAARHLERLGASAAHFGFDLDAAHVAQLLVTVSRDAEAPHRVRLTLARDGVVTATLDPIDTGANDVVRIALAASPVDSHDLFMMHKTTRRVVYETLAAGRPDVDDVVLWNHDGDVVEATRANVLYRLGDRWFTPPLSVGGLPGVGRAALVDAGVVTERRLSIHDVGTVDEWQVVSALRGRRTAVLLP